MNRQIVSMTQKDLQRFIDANGIEATILPMTEQTPTVADAARALGVKTDWIIKSLIFIANDSPLLVINNGMARVDRRKISEHLVLGRSRIKLASPDQALSISGYAVGSMPPFGHKQLLPTFLDKSVLKMDSVFAGGGDIDAMMRLTSGELLRVTRAKVLDISE
jgi:Cys-tRNA(Pro) deacylase